MHWNFQNLILDFLNTMGLTDYYCYYHNTIIIIIIIIIPALSVSRKQGLKLYMAIKWY